MNFLRRLWRHEEREKEQRRGLHQERTEALHEWKLKTEVRTKAIQERRDAWEQEKIDRTADQEAALAAGEKFKTKKPTLGKLPPTIPRPPVVSVGLDDKDNEDDEGLEA